MSFDRRTFALPFLLAAGVLLAACSSGRTPSGPSPDADVAAIRALLAQIEQAFDAGDLDAAGAVFADDAMVLAHATADVVGNPAIRAMYESATAQVKLGVRFHTEEIEPRGDLAYERGTYTLTVADKATGREVASVVNRHIHIFKRQADGGWKTWRMMTNSADAAPAP
jgi:uncharacterized protein (TIGR02246 family)